MLVVLFPELSHPICASFFVFSSRRPVSHSSTALPGDALRRQAVVGPMRSPVLMLLFALLPTVIGALRCAQCNGWHGHHPLTNTQANTCDNRNNQCQTDQFCVKIVDPMAPYVSYTSFKSDCWFQTSLQVTPTNVTTVMNRECYDYQDASVPSKRWKYCFCNDKDYCNGLSSLLGPFALFFSFFFIF